VRDTEGFWDLLTEAERATLTEAGRPRSYARAMPLCYQGEPPTHVLILLTGWVKVVVFTPNGHAAVLAIRGPGDIIGESGPLHNRARSATVYALDEVKTLNVPGSRFSSFLDDHAHASRVLAQVMVGRMDDADQRMAARLTADGAGRLAVLLVELAERYGVGDPIVIGPPLSQQELAGWVGDSRETVARALRSWRLKGIIKTGRRRITITDLAALKGIMAGADEPGPGWPPPK
jgi:CRP/FNR family transcriptional regulator, cyclic AMP receptor protein